MLDRPPSSTLPHKSEAVSRGVPDRDALIRFLVHRQFSYLASREQDESDDDENYIQAKLGELGLADQCAHVGYNGRWNKKADTCYTWWVAGTLKVRWRHC
jgi:geranylgeranyl transferase type-1 subunit beta